MNSPIIAKLIADAPKHYLTPGMRRAIHKLNSEWQVTSAIGESWLDLAGLVTKGLAEMRINPAFRPGEDLAMNQREWRAHEHLESV